MEVNGIPVGWIFTAFGVLICLMLAPMVFAPLLVLLMLKFKRPVQVVPVDPRTEPLPEDLRRYFHEAYQALTAQGFQLAGTMYLPKVVPNVKSLVALYVNRQTGEQAMTTFMIATSGIDTMQARYVEYFTQYTDGVRVQTNNSPELSAFQRLPNEYTTQFFDVHDLNQLCQLHRYLCGKYRQAGQPFIKLDTQYAGNPLEYVARSVFEETLDAQVETGYLRKAPEAYYPTIRGALIMGWQEAWPIKPIRRRRRRRAAQQVLAEFRPT